MRTRTLLGAGVTALALVGAVPASASAAAPVTRTAACATSAATTEVTFTTARTGAWGTLRTVQGSGEGAFSDDPAITLRVRDGQGNLKAVRRSTDGSMSLALALRIGGPGWTAQVTVENTLAGACSTPRVRIAVR